MSLDILGWGKVADFVGNVLDKIIPDPKAKAEATLQLMQLDQQGYFKEIDAEMAQMKAQTDINLEEAKSESLFKSGWRPFIGWTGGFGYAYEFLFRPIMNAFVHLYQGTSTFDPFTNLDTGPLVALLVPMLGLGAYRSFEKYQGVHNTQYIIR